MAQESASAHPWLLSLDDATEGIHLVVRPVPTGNHVAPLKFTRLELPEAVERARRSQGPIKKSQQELEFICRRAGVPGESQIRLTVSMQCKVINAEKQPEGRENETSHNTNANADADSEEERALLDLSLRPMKERIAVDALLLLRQGTSRDRACIACPIVDEKEPRSSAPALKSQRSDEGLESGSVAVDSWTSASPATTPASGVPIRGSSDEADLGATVPSDDDLDQETEETEQSSSSECALSEMHAGRGGVAGGTHPSVPKLKGRSAQQTSTHRAVALSRSKSSPHINGPSSLPTGTTPSKMWKRRNAIQRSPGAVTTNLPQKESSPRSPRADKRHKCKQCGMSFTIKADYARHADSHTDEVRWRCDVCGVLLSRKDAALRHLRVAHSTQERRFTRITMHPGEVGGRDEE